MRSNSASEESTITLTLSKAVVGPNSRPTRPAKATTAPSDASPPTTR